VQSLEGDKNVLIEQYENSIASKMKEIEDLNAMLNGSRKEIEVLNIQEQYVTKYKQHSSNDLGSQNELNSPHSSNHSDRHTPKSFYDKY
jgi:hypothetical protein